jgi:methionyl-tRNA formyltransferase
VKRPRLAFLGSPAFAVPSLLAAMDVCDVPLVLTQPDRPAGRGRKLIPTAVRQASLSHGLEVTTSVPRQRRDIEQTLIDLQLDVLLVVAFGHILKPSFLQTAPGGAVNVHASLLPRWRGVSPVEQAILAGDDESGVTLMQLDEGVDTGPMIAQRRVVIEPQETRLTLLDKLAEEGATLVRQSLIPYIKGDLATQEQPATGSCYAPRLQKSMGQLDWRHDAHALDRQVRAFHGWPGCYTTRAGERLKVHATRPLEAPAQATPGTILPCDDPDAVQVACGQGALQLLEVQLPGRQRVAAATLLSSGRLAAGMQFEFVESGAV